MLFLGHVGPAVFSGAGLKLPLAAVAFFSLFPDLVDKPLFALGFTPYPRFIAHSVLVLAAVVLVVHAFSRELGAAAFVGCGLHLLLDFNGFLPLFYPFVQYSFPSSTWPYAPALNLLSLSFEVIGGLLLVAARLESPGDKLWFGF